MLILNQDLKHSQYIPLSAYYLHYDTITHHDLAYLKKIGNYQQTFYVVTKNNGKAKTEKKLTLESLDFIH